MVFRFILEGDTKEVLPSIGRFLRDDVPQLVGAISDLVQQVSKVGEDLSWAFKPSSPPAPEPAPEPAPASSPEPAPASSPGRARRETDLEHDANEHLNELREERHDPALDLPSSGRESSRRER